MNIAFKTSYHRLVRVGGNRCRIQRRLKRSLWDVIRRKPKWWTLVGYIGEDHGIVLIAWYEFRIKRPGDLFIYER